MVIKQYAFNCNEKLIQDIDKIVSVSNLKYRDRSQFIILAIQKLIKEEKQN
ncbi:hypothetical protein HY448_01690 [Candidatus Pacearchaeota archaeon]|nr:hypothetical protein [Candidatus Pacearchaeota archaeon]